MPSQLSKMKLLKDFLIPHLNNGTFKNKLFWVDKSKNIFCIFWRHQSSSKFLPDDSLVFREWAIAKGLWNPLDIKALTVAKQRLRAALLKLKNVKFIHRNLEYRFYKIIGNEDQVPHVQSERHYCALWQRNDFVNDLLTEELCEENFIDQLLADEFRP